MDITEQFPKDAEILQEAIIEIPRRDVALLLETGYLLIEFQRLKEAEEVFLGVCALLPKSDAPYIALGNLYFSQSEFEKALNCHKKATELRPESALAHAHMAECLFSLFKETEAVAAIEKALSLEPDGVNADFAKNLLDMHEAGIWNKFRDMFGKKK